MRIFVTAVLMLVTLGPLVQAEPRHRDRHGDRHESHNYIIERQQAGQVSGVPIGRRYIGGREIDIYRNGAMFEKNNLVGFTR